jgi:flavin-dependent dehydrogenase
VALVERSDFTRFRIGETLEPRLGPLLAEVGVACDGDVPWAVPSPGTASAWGSSVVTKRPTVLDPHGRAWRVDRRAFDQTLFERAGLLGAAVFPRAGVAEVGWEAGCWTFTIVSGDRVLLGRAPFVVEATGRHGASSFAPAGRRRWLDRLVGVAILGTVTIRATSRHGDGPLIESTPGGWWYSVALPSGEMLAVFFTDADCLPGGRDRLLEFLGAELQRAERTRERIELGGGSSERHRVQCFDARSSIRQVAASDRWAATGDALIAVDPLCGQGVTQALGAGFEVADWLAGPRGREGTVPDWARRAAERFNRYMEERIEIYSRETRWRELPFWQRRLGTRDRSVSTAGMVGGALRATEEEV